MPNYKAIVEDLKTAKARLTREVWGQGVNGPGMLCAEGKECLGMVICDVDEQRYLANRNFSSADVRQSTYFFMQIMQVDSIPVWNDTHTFEEVHAGLDKVIATAELLAAQ